MSVISGSIISSVSAERHQNSTCVLIFIEKSGDTVSWLAFATDAAGKIQVIKRANFDNGKGVPTDWTVISVSNLPTILTVLDPETTNTLYLYRSEDNRLYKMHARVVGKNVFPPMSADCYTKGQWELDLNFLKVFKNKYPNYNYTLCHVEESLKAEIKTQYKAYCDAQPQTWDLVRNERIDLEKPVPESTLSTIQKQIVTQLIHEHLQSLKRKTETPANYTQALSAVILGTLDEAAREKLGDETFVNALVLRTQFLARTIDMLPTASFYCETGNAAAQAVTIADVRAYIFRILYLEFQRYHTPSEFILVLPQRIKSEEVKVGLLSGNDLTPIYTGMDQAGTDLLILLYRALEHSLLSLSLDEIQQIELFFQAAQNRNLSHHQLEVAGYLDTAVRAAGMDYERQLNNLLKQLSDVKAVKQLLQLEVESLPAEQINEVLNNVVRLRIYFQCLSGSAEQIQSKIKAVIYLLNVNNYVLGEILAPLNENLLEQILEILKPKLEKNIKDVFGLCSFLRDISKNQRGIVLVALKLHLVNIIKDNGGFEKVLQLLNKKSLKFVFKKIKLHLLKIIKSGYGLGSALEPLDRSQFRIVLKMLKSRLVKIIKDGSGLGSLLRILNEKQTMFVLEILKPNILTIIKNGRGLSDVLCSLNINENLRDIVLETLKLHLEKIMENGRDGRELGWVLNTLNEKQMKFVLNTLKPNLVTIIKNGRGLQDVLWVLDIQKWKFVLEALKPYLETIINDGIGLRDVLCHLNEKQLKLVLKMLKPHLVTIIKDGSGLNSVMYWQCDEYKLKLVLKTLMPYLLTIIKDGSGLGDVLRWPLEEYNRDIVLETLKPHLHTIIKDGSGLDSVLSPLNDTQRKFVLDILITTAIQYCDRENLSVRYDRFFDESKSLVTNICLVIGNHPHGYLRFFRDTDAKRYATKLKDAIRFAGSNTIAVKSALYQYYLDSRIKFENSPDSKKQAYASLSQRILYSLMLVQKWEAVATKDNQPSDYKIFNNSRYYFNK